MKELQNVLSHLTVIFVGVFLTLVVLNVYNPSMQFLSSTISQVFLVGFCLTALALAIVTIQDNRRRAAAAYRHETEAARAKHVGGTFTRRF